MSIKNMPHVDNRYAVEKVAWVFLHWAAAHATLFVVLKGIGVADTPWSLVLTLSISWIVLWTIVYFVTSYVCGLRDKTGRL